MTTARMLFTPATLRAEIVDNPAALSHGVVLDDAVGPVAIPLPKLLALGADQSIADALNAPTREVTRPALLDINAIMGAMTPTELGAFFDAGITQRIVDDIGSNKHDNVQRWVSLAAARGVLSPASVTAISELVATMASVTVSRAVELWGDGASVSVNDVATARMSQ